MFTKLDGYTKLIANLSDKPTETASELKAYFDSSPEEIRVAFNTLIDELSAVTDGSSGADGIGATGIEGLDGATVQALLESLKGLSDDNKEYLLSQIQGAVIGQIPDGSITDVKLSDADGQIKQTVSEHFADVASQVTGKGADMIGLPDPNSLFTATNVGGAMQELFTNVSSGKSQVGTAITDVDPNVVVPTNPTFQDLADSVRQISTGKKWASGVSSADASTGFSINGLDFTPSLVFWVFFSEPYIGIWTSLDKWSGNHLRFGSMSLNNDSNYGLDSGNVSVSAGSFSITNLGKSGTISWWAYE